MAQNKNVQKAQKGTKQKRAKGTKQNVQKAQNFYAFFKFCVFSSNKRVCKILIKENK